MPWMSGVRRAGLAVVGAAGLCFLAAGCPCNATSGLLDDTLKVEVTAGAGAGSTGVVNAERVCGASVVATDVDNGAQKALTEHQDNHGCYYTATVRGGHDQKVVATRVGSGSGHATVNPSQASTCDGEGANGSDFVDGKVTLEPGSGGGEGSSSSLAGVSAVTSSSRASTASSPAAASSGSVTSGPAPVSSSVSTPAAGSSLVAPSSRAPGSSLSSPSSS